MEQHKPVILSLDTLNVPQGRDHREQYKPIILSIDKYTYHRKEYTGSSTNLQYCLKIHEHTEQLRPTA
jgi:hypothetical protein